MLQFTKAEKKQAKLRLAVFGPSGAGKTFTSLRVATGIGGPIAFIDTERRTASKYADRFTFDVLELPKRDISTYCDAIRAAGQAGYPVLIVDSLSHAWQELLEEVDKLARSKFQGNTWSAWSEGTPKQRLLVDTILDFPGHIIATMRSKTEWSIGIDEKTGKNKPSRVGLAPEQGKGIEYEFDLLMELTTDHIGTIIKDRTGKYQDQMIDKPGEALGQELVTWLNEGAPLPAKAAASFVTDADLERASAVTSPKGLKFETLSDDQLMLIRETVGKKPERSRTTSETTMFWAAGILIEHRIQAAKAAEAVGGNGQAPQEELPF